MIYGTQERAGWRFQAPREQSEPKPADPWDWPEGARPKAVEISFWLWIGNLVLDAVVVVYGFITGAVAVGVALGLLVLFIAVLVFLMRDGQNWARIVLAVLGGLFLMLWLSDLTSTPGATLATVLLQLAPIVAMFRPTANAWFRSRHLGV